MGKSFITRMLGTFTSEEEYDYERKISVVSTRTSKNVGSKPYAHAQYGKFVAELRARRRRSHAEHHS